MKARASFILLALATIPAMAQFQVSEPGGSPTPPAIHDIRPPLDVFPYPLWMVVTGAALAGVLLALIAAAIVRYVRSRPAPLPPGPREIALDQLREAEAHLDTDQPYDFSIRVSDILRQFIDAQFGLRSLEQTSPEFLAAVADSPKFTHAEKRLLAEFLERCDLIKFARIDASREDSRELLAQAVRFVKGGTVA